MTPQRAKQISKYLSLVLRHDPSAAGVTPDRGGWVDIDTLIAGARDNGMSFTRTEFLDVVQSSDKQRFTLDPSGNRVRAAQGHSFPVDLGLAPTTPPAVLFHGTAATNVAAIQQVGLKPGSRQQVHLSENTATARTVGARHGKPVIFSVDAARADKDGLSFFVADNGVWLCDHVAPAYLELMDEE